MHPFYAAWQRATHRFVEHSHRAQHGHCDSRRRWFGGRCGPGGGDNEGRGGFGFGGNFGGGDEGGFDGGGSFGVRRPLRFLAYKLDLDERQVAELAMVLDTVKTERAQAEVDQRRTTAAYADLLAGESFDAEAASKVSAERVQSAERLQKAVQASLAKIHALLEPEQRKRLTYLLRTGALRL